MTTITSGANILVVEDTQVNLLFLEKILSEQGYNVHPSSDGPSALSAAQANPPDLILLDVLMPGMSGHQVCEKLKDDERTRNIPVLFISTSDEILDKVRAFFVGGVDYITKPFHAEEVLARVETHLALRNLQKSVEQQNRLLQQEIHERKQIEQFLKESEERYRRLVDLSPDAIVVHQSGKVVYANAATVKLLAATTSNEVIGKSILNIVHPDYHNIMQEGLRQAFKEGKPTDLLEEKFIRLDGKEIDVEAAKALINYRGKSAIQIVVRDITERKQAEDLLRRLQKAVETTEVGITITDKEGRIVYINPADANMHGYTVEEVLNQRSNIFTTPEFREDVIRKKEETEEFVRWKRERSNVRKDGSTFPVMLISNPIYDEENTFVGRVTVCEDMSERKRTEGLLQEKEGLLQESEKRYYKMFQNATVGIFQATASGKFITANSALARMLGYASAEQFAKTVNNIAEQVFVEPRHWDEITDMIQRTPEPAKVETRCRYKDGGEVYVLLNIWTVLDDRQQVRYFEGFLEDITERRQTEKIVQRQELLLRGVARAMNHLLVGTNLRSSIIDALEILGFVTEVDRINIFETHHHPETGKPLMSQRFTWTKGENEVQLNVSDLQNIPYDKGFQRWYDILSSNKLLCKLVQDFPRSERALLESQGILSVLVVPITIRQEFWGFIEFDDCQTKRCWDEEEKSFLIAMAGSIGGAIALQQAKR